MVVSIQYVRGLAALLVLMHHSAWKGAQYGDAPLDWFRVGDVGVDFFFIVSGFIMCFTTENRHRAPGEVSQFLKKRVIRILPLYWTLTLFALAAFLIMPSNVNSGEATTVWQSFLLIPSEAKFLIQNGWTLSYEFYFYLLFSLGLMFERRSGRIGVAVGLALLAGLGYVLPSREALPVFLTDAIILEFGLGFVLYHLYVKVRNMPAWGSGIAMVAGVLALVAVNQGIRTDQRILDYGLPAFLITMGLVWLEPALSRNPVRMLQRLGDWSYSLYLVHPFILTVDAILLSKLGMTHGGWSLFFMATLLAGSIVGGYLCYAWIEQPFTRFFKRMERSGTKACPATVPA